MITLEQKKQLQIDAGIPHLPTDLTYECRMAISGEGNMAHDWSDKPHRLVYDLSRQVEADADRIKQLEAKLAKVVNAARAYRIATKHLRPCPETSDGLDAVLAELEEKKC